MFAPIPSESASVSSVASNGKASVSSGVPSLSSSVSSIVPYGVTVAGWNPLMYVYDAAM